MHDIPTLSVAQATEGKLVIWLKAKKTFSGDYLILVGSLFSEQKFYHAKLFANALNVLHILENNLPCSHVLCMIVGTFGAGYDKKLSR